MIGDHLGDVQAGQNAGCKSILVRTGYGKEYEEKLGRVVEGKGDVIGYAFAVNGEINCADVYGCHDLFIKLWKKLFTSTVIEAVSSLHTWKKEVKSPGASAISDFLRNAEKAKARSKKVTDRIELLTSETDEFLFYESRDSKRGQWVYRNYLTKEGVFQGGIPRDRPRQRNRARNRQ